MSRFLGLLALIALPLAAQQPGQTDIALASNGIDFLASFAQGNRPALQSAHVATLKYDDKSFGPTEDIAVFSTPQFGVSQQAVAFGSNIYLHAMQDRLTVAVRRIASNGIVIDKDPIRIDSVTTPAPAVASDGTNFMVVWGSGAQLLAVIVAPDGTVGPIRTLVERNGFAFNSPRIAFDGTRYVVTYKAGSFIEAMVVTRDGVAGSPIGLFETVGRDAPIASSGADFLTVANVGNDVVAWSLMADGMALRVNRKTTLLHGLDTSPSVAWSGMAYIVVWRAFGPYNEPESPRSFLGATHVRSDGTFDALSAIETGLGATIRPFAPAVAVDNLGVEMIVIEQQQNATARATPYRSEEVLGHHVEPPAAPTVTSVRIGANGATLTWTRQSANERGFIIQADKSILVPAGTTALTIPVTQIPMTVTVAAWNEAGTSQPATARFLLPHRTPGRR